jgi:hypothetical protein
MGALGQQESAASGIHSALGDSSLRGQQAIVEDKERLVCLNELSLLSQDLFHFAGHLRRNIDSCRFDASRRREGIVTISPQRANGVVATNHKNENNQNANRDRGKFVLHG